MGVGAGVGARAAVVTNHQRGPAAAGAVAAAQGERGGSASGRGGQWPRTRLPSHVPHASHLSGRLGHCVPGPGLAVTPVCRWCLQEGSGLDWALGGGPRRPGGIGISSVAQGTAAAPGFPVHHRLARLAQTHVRPVGDAIQASHLLSGRPRLLLPSIRVFSRESVLRVRWPEDRSFSFSLSPSNEYPGLISSRMDGLGLLAVQGTLKSLLQHRSPKASILRHSAFFILHLSHLFVTAGEAVAFTRRTLVTPLVSAFGHAVKIGHSFSPKEANVFSFHGRGRRLQCFGGAPPNEVSPAFCCFPVYLP